MINNPASQSLVTHRTPTSSLFIVLLTIIFLRQDVGCAPFVFESHQFQLMGSPLLTWSASPKLFTRALPAQFNSTYKRYLVLSGFDFKLRDTVSFKAELGTSTPTSQAIKVTTASSMDIFLLSVQVVFIAPNPWIWAFDSTFQSGVINSYGPWIFFIPLGPCCDDAYLPIPLTVSNLADFKVFAFISWYDAVGRNILGWPFPPTGPAITVQISAVQLQPSVPPKIKVSLRRDDLSQPWQLFKKFGYVVVIVNTTQLLNQNYPYTFGRVESTSPFSSFPNLGVSSTYVSSVYGGLQGNCLIGLTKVNVGGHYGVKINRGPSFTKSYPLTNILNGLNRDDKFSAAYNTLCFTGVVCPVNTFYSPTASICVLCTLANCDICQTLTICKTCSNLYGWSSPACVLCTSITAGCKTCANSTYCTSCIDNHYVLKQSSCLLCSAFITGCDTCNNGTSCIACLAVGYYTDTISCILCASALPFCLNCDNNTVCLECQLGYYQETNGSCVPCNSPLPYCGQCDNSSICIACITGYFLAANNSCIQCSYFLPNCSACLNNVTCTQCYSGYFLNNSNCYVCSSAPTLKNCSQCSSGTFCTSCYLGYYVDGGTCHSCTDLPFCIMCNSSTTCIQCQSNYLLSGIICVPCVSVLSNCLTCDNSTYCTSCVSASFYILPALGFCLPCSASVLNCNQCQLIYLNNTANVTNTTNSTNATNSSAATPSYQIICHSCIIPWVIEPNNTCEECDVLIPYCGTCANYTFCDNCMDNTYAYIIENISCIQCSSIFRNCSECTTQICTKCQAGFKFTRDFKGCICLLGDYVNGVCNTIIGCTKPFYKINGDIGCLECLQPTFFIRPVNDYCQCRRGTLIGHVCSEIDNCIAALISLNGSIYCAFCNTTAGFYYKPQNLVRCVCSPHLQSNGTFCLDVCGDGYLMNDTKGNCDDNNTIGGDGCSENCLVETSYRCQNGSNETASVCYFIGSKVQLSLYQVYKSDNLNQGVFEFKVQPPIQILKRMDFSKYLQIACNSSYSFNSASYDSGILAIKVDYTQDLQGLPCSLSLSFDKQIVRTPNITKPFNATSNNLPLIIANYLTQLVTIGLSFKILGNIVLGAFGISIARKLLGAELLICCQIVYLSNSFYKIPSVYMEPIKNFQSVTGGWSYFFKKTFSDALAPFSRRVQMSLYFLQNTLFILSALLFIVIFVSLVILFFKLKQACKKKPEVIKKPQKFGQADKSIPYKIIKFVYRHFAFPLAAGFFMIIVVSSYVHNNNLDTKNNGEFHPLINGISSFFAWSVLGIILNFQVFGSFVLQNEWVEGLVGQINAKKWYIHVFIVRLVLVTVTIELGINYSYDLLLLVLGGIEIVYLFITAFAQAYTKTLDNIGVICCVLTQCFSISMPLILRYVSISQDKFVMMVFALIGLLFVSIALTTIRNFIAIKNAIMQLMKSSNKTQAKQTQAKQAQAEQAQAKKDSQTNNINERYFKDTLIREAILQKEEPIIIKPNKANLPQIQVQDFKRPAEDPKLTQAKNKLRQNLKAKRGKVKKDQIYE